MGNNSKLYQIAQNIRAAGTKDNVSGLSAGGVFIPRHRKADGSIVNARWEGNFYINGKDWYNKEGVKVEANNVIIRITAWNNENSTDGKGLADVFAKHVSKGKELSAMLRMTQFKQRLFLKGVPQTDHEGNPITINQYGWTIDSNLDWGDDSAALLKSEISKFQEGVFNFESRPQDWNVANSAGKEQWLTLLAWRKGITFQGEPTYGYARVVVPEGATMIDAAGNAITAKTPGSSVPKPPQSKPELTYQMMIDGGWTDETLRANNYGYLIPETVAVPKPPVQGEKPTSAAEILAGGAAAGAGEGTGGM